MCVCVCVRVGCVCVYVRVGCVCVCVYVCVGCVYVCVGGVCVWGGVYVLTIVSTDKILRFVNTLIIMKSAHRGVN